MTASFKYPGFVLLVPLVVAGWGQWRRLAVAAALAPAAFLAASPYFAVHLGAALDDVLRVQRGVRRGWLGFESDPWAPIAFLDRLWEGIGPALLVALGGLVLALVYRTLADRVLAVFVLAYFLTLMPLDTHFDRYVLPLVPALGALAGRFPSAGPGDAPSARDPAGLVDPGDETARTYRHACCRPRLDGPELDPGGARRG